MFKQAPSVWGLKRLLMYCQEGTCQAEYSKGIWSPARPIGFFSLANRIKLAWMVFTGKADALLWGDNYQDWADRINSNGGIPPPPPIPYSNWGDYIKSGGEPPKPEQAHLMNPVWPIPPRIPNNELQDAIDRHVAKSADTVSKIPLHLRTILSKSEARDILKQQGVQNA